MQYRILGSLEVLDGERVLDVGGGKQRSVLALLLLHANEVVSSDRLIDELWPAEPPPSAAKIIQAHVSRLRKALDSVGDEILLTRGHGYVLRVGPDQLDVDRFSKLLEEGRAELADDEPEKAAVTLQDALALWRGPPLGEFAYDSFAREEIGRLEELHLAATEERIEADLALGRHDAVVQELEQLARRHPLRERLRGQLMLALYRSGRHAEALEVYRDLRRTLAEELGLEPSPTLQQLERAILAHDEALQAPRSRVARRRTRRKGALLVVAGAAVLIAAAISVAVIELTGTGGAQGLASVPPDSVGVIDPDTNKIVDYVPVGSAPTRIAFHDGTVWVISEQDEILYRIDAKTRTTRAIALDGPPIDLAVGGDAVWVLVSSDTALGAPVQTPSQLIRIDPSLNAVVRRISLGGGASLAAEGGIVWVVNPNARLTVSRIDAATNRRDATFTLGPPSFGFDTGTVGGVPGASGLGVGDGAIWVGGDPGVIRINASSSSISETIGLGVVVPTAVAFADGAVWVAARPGFHCCPQQSVGKGTLTRIDASSNTVEDVIPIGGGPAGLAVGEGAIWVADPATRSVVRVDPSSDNVVKRIRVGARPRGIAVGNGLLWVSVG
jgi:YVTN family beta-propeller protein